MKRRIRKYRRCENCGSMDTFLNNPRTERWGYHCTKCHATTGYDGGVPVISTGIIAPRYAKCCLAGSIKRGENWEIGLPREGQKPGRRPGWKTRARRWWHSILCRRRIHSWKRWFRNRGGYYSSRCRYCDKIRTKGEPLPPEHINCRCTTFPIETREERRSR